MSLIEESEDAIVEELSVGVELLLLEEWITSVKKLTKHRRRMIL